MTYTFTPTEILSRNEDDGTMPENVERLGQAVVGRRIVSFESPVTIKGRYWGTSTAARLTLDDGTIVTLANTSDCCAYTELDGFLLNADKIDHIITGVSTEGGYTKWHIFADAGDVLELNVGWSSGNPFYYGYGFDIVVATPGQEEEY